MTHTHPTRSHAARTPSRLLALLTALVLIASILPTAGATAAEATDQAASASDVQLPAPTRLAGAGQDGVDALILPTPTGGGSTTGAGTASYKAKVRAIANSRGCWDVDIIIDTGAKLGGSSNGTAAPWEAKMWIRNGLTTRLDYVVTHECAHVKQHRAYGGAWYEMQDAMNRVYGGSGYAGLEANADCVAARYGVNLGTYTSSCGGARGEAARAVDNLMRYGVQGWYTVGNTWYFADSSGRTVTGWLYTGGAWYHLGASGGMTTGWLLESGTWYHLGASGAMTTGWLRYGGAWYHLGAGGGMTTGWLLESGTWYHLGASGAMSTGWLQYAGAWYYLAASGAMVTGEVTIDGRASSFSPSGAWLGYRPAPDQGAHLTT